MKNKMTKQKISITINKETADLVDELLQYNQFRNRSHVFEFALNKFMEEER